MGGGGFGLHVRIAGCSSCMFTWLLPSACRAVVIDTMVDRVVAMLNYFLSKLIGPERNAIKVIKGGEGMLLHVYLGVCISNAAWHLACSIVSN